MIGLVLGDTQLGNLIIKKLKLIKKKFLIIDISKKKNIQKKQKFFFIIYRPAWESYINIKKS